MNSSLVVAGLLLCLSGGMAVKEHGRAVSSDIEAQGSATARPDKAGAPGIRAPLLPGQAAIIQVSGTTFDKGKFNGRYTQVSNSDGLRLYRLGSSDRWCGYCPRNRLWVIGWNHRSVQSGLGIYQSPAGGHNTIPVIGWRANRAWPGSSPAPTVSVLGVASPKPKRG